MKLSIYKVLNYSILFLVVVSCKQNQSEIYGTYSPKFYKNTFDTLIIERNGFYIRKVFDKNGKNLLNYKAKYILNGNSIKFNDFYFNLDKDLIAFPEDIKDIDLTYTTNIEKIDGKIGFCFGYHEGENCYLKIESK